MKQKDYLAAADVLRVAALGIVAWYHFWQLSWLNPGFSLFGRYVNLQEMIRGGYMMVDVLLVLSGFLLAMPHAKARGGRHPVPATRDYFRRRFWRIMPSYALALFLVLLLYAMPQNLYAAPDAIFRDLLAHLTFTHNLTYDSYFLTPMPIVLWTLAVEVQFYILFPLLARRYRERPWLVCLGLTAAGLFYRVIVYPYEDTTIWINQLPAMLDLYACGMAAALLYTRWKDKVRRALPRAALALAAMGCFLLLLQILYLQPAGDFEDIRHGQLFWRLPIGLLSGGFLLGGCLAPAGLCRAMGNPVTQFLSAISYNFYIWHQFLAVRLREWRIPPYTSDIPYEAGEQPWQSQYMLLCFFAAGVLAVIITYAWERPMLRRGLGTDKKTVPVWFAREKTVDSSRPV